MIKDNVKVTTHRDLVVWQKAMALVTDVYQLINSFPKEELNGLTIKIRKSAVVIPSHIAEGYGRKSRKEYANYLRIACDALRELRTLVGRSFQLNYISQEEFNDFNQKSSEIEETLSGLSNKLKELIA